MRQPLDISYDAWNDILTIEGVRYSGELFRTFGIGPMKGRLLRIVKKEDGIVTLHGYDVDEIAFEMWFDRQKEKRRLDAMK